MVFAKPYNHYREMRGTAYPIKQTCKNCGFSKAYKHPDQTEHWDLEKRKKYYYYTLWLKDKHRGIDIWAVNEAHLDFIDRFVNDEISKRDISSVERSAFDYLPTWLQKEKVETNRFIKKMRVKLIDGN